MRTSTLTLSFFGAAVLAGCASPRVDVQWRNIDTPVSYLRGATVLVSCETPDLTLRRICEDQLAADLAAHGARPVQATSVAAPPAPAVGDQSLLPAARESGAKAVFSLTLQLASQRISPGVTVGIGGFGFGRNVAGGVGLSAPVGGGELSNGYAANGRVTDVGSGRLMWSARASAPPSSDTGAQVAGLSRQVLDAATGAGLF